MRYLRAFATFLYDFLVGDSWELFVGPLVVLGVGAVLVTAGVPTGIVGAVLFVGVVVVIAINLTLSLRQAE